MEVIVIIVVFLCHLQSFTQTKHLETLNPWDLMVCYHQMVMLTLPTQLTCKSPVVVTDEYLNLLPSFFPSFRLPSHFPFLPNRYIYIYTYVHVHLTIMC